MLRIPGADVKQIMRVDLERAFNVVVKNGHYANGDWLHVRGGYEPGLEPYQWTPMRFEA